MTGRKPPRTPSVVVGATIESNHLLLSVPLDWCPSGAHRRDLRALSFRSHVVFDDDDGAHLEVKAWCRPCRQVMFEKAAADNAKKRTQMDVES